MGKIIYTGVFFDASALYAAMNKHLPRKKLHRQIENPHVTKISRESPLRELWDERPISWCSQACKDWAV